MMDIKVSSLIRIEGMVDIELVVFGHGFTLE
jgi:hypothetical protein